MSESATFPDDDWSSLVDRLAGDLDLDALAKSTRALVRRRGVPDARALLRLALARGPGGFSLRETAAWAHLMGVAELTDPSLNDRLHQSCDFLAAIMAAQLRAKIPGACFRWPGRILRLADGSCVSKPGSKGTDWRIHAVYDLGAGGFSSFEVTDRHGGEALDRGAAKPGEIRVADRGYSAAKALRRFLESAGAGQRTDQGTGQAADYVVRLRWSSLRLSAADGTKFDVSAHLRAMPAERSTDDIALSIEGAGAPMPTRVLIVRKPPGAALAERRRLAREAGGGGKKLDPRSLVAAEFIVLATSLDAQTYPGEEVLAMYRLRWQIELAFKRLKSLLNIDRLPSRSERGARSWIFAHLILAIAADDASQDFLESSPSALA